MAFLHGLDLVSLFASLSAIVATTSFAFSNVSSELFAGVVFILRNDPYRVGDWVELAQPGSGTGATFDEKTTLRVEKIFLTHTKFVNLSSNAGTTTANGVLVANYQIINWNRRPVTFQIILQVPVGMSDDLLLLRTFHESMKQYASDNPREWLAVKIVTVNPIVTGSKYKDYCVDIQ